MPNPTGRASSWADKWAWRSFDAAASTAVERLTEKLKSQFPDLVLIVAGGWMIKVHWPS